MVAAVVVYNLHAGSRERGDAQVDINRDNHILLISDRIIQIQIIEGHRIEVFNSLVVAIHVDPLPPSTLQHPCVGPIHWMEGSDVKVKLVLHPVEVLEHYLFLYVDP